MAKKKEPEVVMETPVLVVEKSAKDTYYDTELYPLNGKGVGVYYDEKLKKYVLATLSLSPESDSAIIINKKVLKSSSIAAAMEAEIVLKQLLQKELK